MSTYLGFCDVKSLSPKETDLKFEVWAFRFQFRKSNRRILSSFSLRDFYLARP